MSSDPKQPVHYRLERSVCERIARVQAALTSERGIPHSLTDVIRVAVLELAQRLGCVDAPPEEKRKSRKTT